MSSTYYTSLSGMLSASYGLQNTSNNVANMQSPGFKRNDVFYSSLGYGSGDEGLGSGVCISGSATNFSAGTYIESNNLSDLAIVGQGFFVIRLKSGELLYTRDGEFGFNTDGVLEDRHSGGLVQGYNNAGNLVPIHEKGPKTCEGKATHELLIKGQFVLIEKTEDEKKTDPTPDKSKYKDITFEVANVYDDKGKAHKVTFKFEATRSAAPINDNGTSWDLTDITCDDAEIQFPFSQQIIFSGVGDGTNPLNSSIQFSINGQKPIKLNFGDYKDGSDYSVQLKNPKPEPLETAITVRHNDGYGEGKQTSFSFDENGQISYHYDNGQLISGIFVGLARFDDLEHTLVQSQNNLFRTKSDKGIHFGRANQNGFGSIKAKQLEASNVNSTAEFANIVILQRMFQACSQIMDIDKQLIEELHSK